MAKRHSGKSGSTPSLGKQTARAVMWMYAQSTGVKATTFVAQLILMSLLAKEHFGVGALALSMRALIDIAGRVGMRQILVQRARNFRRWSSAGFWMCIAMGLLAGAMLTVAAPIMSGIYKEPALLGCMVLLAISSPLIATGMVPQARLMADMRFKSIATIEFFAQSSALIATVILAKFGFKAYSFFIPLPFMEVFRSASFWYVSRPKIRLNPQFRRWKYMLGDTSSLFVTNVLTRVVAQADYLILGIFHPLAVVGAYSVAFQLSTQPMQIVTANLTQAMFPALSKLQDDTKRQIRAFLRASRVLTTVYTPLCLLQAATSGPIIRLIFQDGKWDSSIPLLQILSVFGILRVMNGPSTSLLRAQGRFKTNMILQVAYTVTFLSSVTVTAWLYSSIAVALAVGIAGSLFGPVQIYYGLKPAGRGWGGVFEIYRHTTLFGIVAFGVAWAAQWLVPAGLHPVVYYGSQVAITTLLGCGSYAAMLRWLTPKLWDELVEQLKSVNPFAKRKKGDRPPDMPEEPFDQTASAIL